MYEYGLQCLLLYDFNNKQTEGGVEDELLECIGRIHTLYCHPVIFIFDISADRADDEYWTVFFDRCTLYPALKRQA